MTARWHAVWGITNLKCALACCEGGCASCRVKRSMQHSAWSTCMEAPSTPPRMPRLRFGRAKPAAPVAGCPKRILQQRTCLEGPALLDGVVGEELKDLACRRVHRCPAQGRHEQVTQVLCARLACLLVHLAQYVLRCQSCHFRIVQGAARRPHVNQLVGGVLGGVGVLDAAGDVVPAAHVNGAVQAELCLLVPCLPRGEQHDVCVWGGGSPLEILYLRMRCALLSWHAPARLRVSSPFPGRSGGCCPTCTAPPSPPPPPPPRRSPQCCGSTADGVVVVVSRVTDQCSTAQFKHCMIAANQMPSNLPTLHRWCT